MWKVEGVRYRHADLNPKPFAPDLESYKALSSTLNTQKSG